MKSIKSIFFYIIVILSTIIFSSVCITVFVNSARRTWAIIPFIMGMILAYRYLPTTKRAFLSFFACMAIVQLLLGHLLMVDYSTWDVHEVVRAARALAQGTWYNARYFAQYPNNIGLLLFFDAVFQITQFLFGSMSVYFLIILNIAAIDIGVILAFMIARMLYGERLASRVGITLTFFAPLYLYVPICYTDTFVIPFIMGAAYIALKFGGGYRIHS